MNSLKAVVFILCLLVGGNQAYGENNSTQSSSGRAMSSHDPTLPDPKVDYKEGWYTVLPGSGLIVPRANPRRLIAIGDTHADLAAIASVFEYMHLPSQKTMFQRRNSAPLPHHCNKALRSLNGSSLPFMIQSSVLGIL